MDGVRHPLLSYQPLRLLLQVTYSASIIARLPYYSLLAYVPSLRPNRAWTAKQTFMTRLLYSLLDLKSRIGITETLTLEKGEEGDRFQTVKPSDLDVYKGPLIHGAVHPETIGGTWFPSAPGADVEGKTVFLYFHGGAFIQGDGRDASCAPLAKRLLKKGGADAVFSVQYRLSGYGGVNPFPAALQDALSSYLFLLNELHVPAEQIVVGGDSAGGNLTTALLRYLDEFGPDLKIPAPKCALLLSPWVAPFEYDTTGNPNVRTDYVPPSFPRWGAHAYADSWPDTVPDPYITPLGNPFRTIVPIFVNAASAEFLYEMIMQFTKEMRGIEGNIVELYHEKDAVHDTFLVGEVFGFEDSAWNVAAQIGEFVSKH